MIQKYQCQAWVVLTLQTLNRNPKNSSQTIWINLLPPLCDACVNTLFIDCVWPAWPLTPGHSWLCTTIRENNFSCNYWIDGMTFALKCQAHKTTRSVYCTLKVLAFRKTMSHRAPMSEQRWVTEHQWNTTLWVWVQD